MKIFENFKDKINDSGIDFYKKQSFQKISWIIIVVISLSAIVTIDFLPDKVNLKVGQVTKNDIIAPKTVKYIDQQQTEELREEAANSVSKVYEEDVTVLATIKQEINDLFLLLQKSNEESKKISEQKVAGVYQEIKAKTTLELSSKEIEYLLSLSQEQAINLKDDILIILVKYLNRGVKSDYIDKVKEQITQEVMNLNRDNKYQNIMIEISHQLIEPNLIFNLEETQKKKREARERVKPKEEIIHKDEVIIRHGMVVTHEDMKQLEVLGLRNIKINYLNIIGYSLVVLLFLVLIIIYIIQYQKEIIADRGVVALLGLLPIIILLFAKIANYIPVPYPSFIVPVAAASIIIAILIDTDLAIVFTIGLAFLVAIVSGEGIIDVAVAIISGLTGIYSVSKLSQRSDLVRAGFIVGGVNSLTILVFMLTKPSLDFVNLLKILPLGLLNGVIVAVLTNGLLPYIENIFGITSPVKLLELSNPNHPLLKRLLVEAPGTYHHSIIVGNLAESAADKVEADSLLARVVAYYHDIGKVKRSYFFTENQIGTENPHDKLSPSLSTLIITSHIKDGIELAKEYRLPQIIIDIITQHHGTSLVSFFYQEASYDEKYENVDEEDFRYDGPKPQTKEAALIMLADVVEAAVRSNQSAQSNPGKLEKLVRKLIKAKLNSGQLDECNLTLKDLDKVGTAFVSILKGIFHNRIEYPDDIAQQIKEGKKLNGHIDK